MVPDTLELKLNVSLKNETTFLSDLDFWLKRVSSPPHYCVSSLKIVKLKKIQEGPSWEVFGSRIDVNSDLEQNVRMVFSLHRKPLFRSPEEHFAKTKFLRGPESPSTPPARSAASTASLSFGPASAP